MKVLNQAHLGKKAQSIRICYYWIRTYLYSYCTFDYFKEMLEKVLLFKEIAQEGSFHLFEVGEGGNGAQVIVEHNTILPQAQTRFWYCSSCCISRRRSQRLEEWIERLSKLWFPNVWLCGSSLL